MLIIKSLHLINLHFWTYLLTILDFWRFLVNIVICSPFWRVEDNRLDLLLKGTSAVGLELITIMLKLQIKFLNKKNIAISNYNKLK